MGRTPKRTPAWPQEWIAPYWLECQRQGEPGARDAQTTQTSQTNVTHRNWTVVGNVASLRRATVDERGMITPWAGAWSLDWCIRSEDRWHVPSREASVRQSLLGESPVVETAMRVPGGDVVHRVYAVAAGGAHGELVVVEIENRSAVPFVVGLAVRPVNADGAVGVGHIALRDGQVIVDGRLGLLQPRPPAEVAFGTLASGDAMARLVSPLDGGVGPATEARCPARMAQALFLYPLAHRAVMRVALPLQPVPRRRRSAAVEFPRGLPAPAAVVRGWQAQTRRGMRLDLPAGRLSEAVETNRRALLLSHRGGGDICADPAGSTSFSFADAALLAGALDRYGLHSETAEVLRSLVVRRRASGAFHSRGAHELDATGHALHAIAEHWRLTRDGELRTELLPVVALGARWLSRRRGVPSPWSAVGRAGADELLTGVGAFHPRPAVAWPPQVNPAMLGALVACIALGLLDPMDPSLASVAATVRRDECRGDAVVSSLAPTGLDPALTAQLARLEVARLDSRALRRLRWLIESASSTYTWPTALQPPSGGGCFGPGADGRASAAFLLLIRDLLVREVVASSGHFDLALCSMLPETWVGQPIEVKEAPTAAGQVSFALRWHGPRPALLWDVTPHLGLGGIRVTAPGLDPAWWSDYPRGEALFPARGFAGAVSS